MWELHEYKNEDDEFIAESTDIGGLIETIIAEVTLSRGWLSNIQESEAYLYPDKVIGPPKPTQEHKGSDLIEMGIRGVYTPGKYDWTKLIEDQVDRNYRLPLCEEMENESHKKS